MDTLGWILVEKGQAQRGLALLRKALVKAPKTPSTRYHYAVALAKTHDSASAQAQLISLLKETPNFPEAAAARDWLKQLQTGSQAR
jgi:predicted Zn-dependent protease